MTAAALLLETRQLTRRFGGVTAVAGVDFSLREGELRCLIGPNGAGKSTFFKMLTGLKPSSGDVVFRGASIADLADHEIARAGIGVKTQVPSVFDGLTVREHLRVAAYRHTSRAAAHEVADVVLERLELAPIAARLVGLLSHGQRQWVEIGMVLAQGADLVLLDEPAAGMTKQEVVRTAKLIREINRDKSVIVIEHDMHFVRMLDATVTVFHQGRVLAEGNVDSTLSDTRVRQVYLGKKPA